MAAGGIIAAQRAKEEQAAIDAARGAAGLDFAPAFEAPDGEVGNNSFDEEIRRQEQAFIQDILRAAVGLGRQSGNTFSSEQISDIVAKRGGSVYAAATFFNQQGGNFRETFGVRRNDFKNFNSSAPGNSGRSKNTALEFLGGRATAQFAKHAEITEQRDLQKFDRERMRRNTLGSRSTILTSNQGIVETNILGGSLRI